MRLHTVTILIVLSCTCHIGNTKGLMPDVDEDFYFNSLLKRESQPVIYRGLGRCVVDIPNVQRYKLRIEVSFDKDVFDFDLTSSSYPLFVLTMDGSWKWFIEQPSRFSKVELSNNDLMQQETGREIKFKYNFDANNMPTITCSIKTVA